MGRKMLFVYNPTSGKEQIRNKLSDIVRIFCAADFEVTIFATSGPEDATKIVASKGAEYDYIVCSGGDGTMNEVAAGIMELSEKPVCGYIPAGTVNDFASTLKIPKIMKNAAKLVVSGSIFKCDIGKFNERYFMYVAGFGAFTEVSYQTPQEWKNTLGKLAYFIEALKHISEIKPHHMKIRYDDGMLEDNFILGLISNSISISGYQAYSKKSIKMDDGKFEVLLIRHISSPLELQATINALLTKQLEADSIFCFETSEMEIISDDEIRWTLDGEDGGSSSEVKMINCRQALPIVCDERAYKRVSGITSNN